jgi:hypothetical protein
MMALLAGQSGEHASKAWESQKIENDIVWLGSELTKLKAEVERLTKAGDAMAAMVPAMVCCQVDAKGAVEIIAAWNAAKEVHS